MSRTRHVARAVRAGVPYLQESIEAILVYARQRGNWQVTMGLEYWPVFSAKHLRGWDGDGILAWVNTQSETAVLAELGIPAVNLSAALRDSPVPRVSLDDYAVGRVAAEHLGERGFRRFAHYATTGRWYAQQRETGFVETVHDGGGSCELFHIWRRYRLGMYTSRRTTPTGGRSLARRSQNDSQNRSMLSVSCASLRI